MYVSFKFHAMTTNSDYTLWLEPGVGGGTQQELLQFAILHTDAVKCIVGAD